MTTPNDHGVTVKREKGLFHTLRFNDDHVCVQNYGPNEVGVFNQRGSSHVVVSPAQLRAIGEAFIAAADEFAAEGGG
jgi:hypothetical protein